MTSSLHNPWIAKFSAIPLERLPRDYRDLKTRAQKAYLAECRLDPSKIYRGTGTIKQEATILFDPMDRELEEEGLSNEYP